VSEQQQSFPPISISFNSIRSPFWRRYLQKAIRETEADKLLSLVHDTESALFHRWHELGSDDSYDEERVEMKDATESLRMIKIHRLGWPWLY
jgi:hypothetical protein